MESNQTQAEQVWDALSDNRLQAIALCKTFLDNTMTCAVCLEPMARDTMFDIPFGCVHCFCSDCLQKVYNNPLESKRKCPLCREFIFACARGRMEGSYVKFQIILPPLPDDYDDIVNITPAIVDAKQVKQRVVLYVRYYMARHDLKMRDEKVKNKTATVTALLAALGENLNIERMALQLLRIEYEAEEDSTRALK